MQTKNLEMIVGAFLLAGVIGLLILAFQVSGLGNGVSRQGYEVSATFDNVGDLRVHAPVSLSGVKIGEVTGITLDKKTFRAIVKLKINPAQNNIPADSAASIFTEGLLGSNYINLTPGFSETNLKNNDTILTTHSAIILENLIGQLMFKLNSSQSK